MKNKDKQAFTRPSVMNPLNGLCQEKGAIGLTKREYIAAQAMAAMISNPNIKRPQTAHELESDLKAFSAIAIEYADSLLSALE